MTTAESSHRSKPHPLCHPDRSERTRAQWRACPELVEGDLGFPSLIQQSILYKQNYVNKKRVYPAFLRTFVPIRNNFRTVPVGSRFIWSCNSVTASKNPAIASNRSRV